MSSLKKINNWRYFTAIFHTSKEYTRLSPPEKIKSRRFRKYHKRSSSNTTRQRSLFREKNKCNCLSITRVPETTRLSSPPLFVNALNSYVSCLCFVLFQPTTGRRTRCTRYNRYHGRGNDSRPVPACNKNVFFVARRPSPITVCYYRARFVGLRVLDFSILIKIVKM